MHPLKIAILMYLQAYVQNEECGYTDENQKVPAASFIVCAGKTRGKKVHLKIKMTQMIMEDESSTSGNRC